MKLGILVNSNKNLGHIEGITMVALGAGHDLSIFVMDEGVRLFRENSFLQLTALGGVDTSYCDHSARERDILKEELPGNLVCGSQYNNALMNHDCDRVIVL